MEEIMSVRIGLALGGWPFGSADSAAFWDFVDQAEALGYDSIWLSDRSEGAYRRIGRLGDGWLASFLTTAEFAEGAERIRANAAAAGRAIDEDHYGAILSVCVAGSLEEARALAAPGLRRLRPDV